MFTYLYIFVGKGTEEEAAAAYDMAAIEYRGVNAVTNFDISKYVKLGQVKAQSNSPVGPQNESPEQIQEPEPEPEPVVSSLSQLQYSNHLPSMEIMGPDHDLPWNFWPYSTILVPEVPLGKGGELPDLFYEKGFEDNIDYMFEGGAGNEDESSSADNAGMMV